MPQYEPWINPNAIGIEEGGQKKKIGAMRWLNPDWSIVRWVKNVINDEDENAEMEKKQKAIPFNTALEGSVPVPINHALP